MADKTKIEWTGATWNPIRARSIAADGTERKGWHCEHASEGCRNCYAETFNKRLGTGFDYKPGHLRGDVEVYLDEKMLLQPLKWKKARQIFVCSMTDLFADFVTDEMLDRVFAVMAQSPQHIFQVLTKRSARMRAYLSQHRWHKWAALARELRDQFPKLRTPDIRGGDCCPVPNVWLGVSVENQAAADERIPDLLATPAALRWLSCEPLLGPVDLSALMFIDEECPNWEMEGSTPIQDPETGQQECCRNCDYTGIISVPKIDWVVAGGESGCGARPMHPDWARRLRDQCAAADVPFFFKQWGAWGPAGCVENEGIEDINRGFTKWEYGHFDYHYDFQIDALARSSRGHVDEAYGLKYSGEPDVAMWRVGKKAAGRLLDGVLHDGMPG